MFNPSLKAIKTVQLVLATILGSVFLVQLAGSVFWRQYLDTPLLNYVGFLINEQGLIPYAEIFETSMPGTFLFHTVLGKIAGYSDLAARIADISALLVCLALIYLIIQPAGKIQGAIASLVCGLAYLAHGSRIALQRDFLGLIPVFAAILALQASSKNKISQKSGFFITGLLIGISASFKPHLAIVWPVLLFFLTPENIFLKVKTGLKAVLISLAGFIVSFSVPIIWVWHAGGLNSFLEIFFNYLPLHTHLGHDFQLIPWPDKFFYAIKGMFIFNDYLLFLIAGVIAIYFNKNTEFPLKRRLIVSISAATVAFWFYPAISGQFWYYHWLPFQFMVIILASFLLNPSPALSNRIKMFATILFVFIIPLQTGLSPEFIHQLNNKEIPAPLNGVPDQIADFLKKNLKPGDKVQALDWVNGAIHGMLEAKAFTATRYLYDYHFYHHISHPFIKNLRHDFITKLKKAPPRFFIYVFLKSRVTGPDTSMEFPELGKFLFKNYKPVVKNPAYAIFEIKDK